MKTFKIAFILPNGNELYFAYGDGHPYLTRYFCRSYDFVLLYYSSKRERDYEAEKFKRYFFGNLDIKTKIIM